MKTLAFMFLVGISLSAAAQDRDRDDRDRGRYQDNRDYHAYSNAPNRVYRNFRRDHPDARDEQWEHNGRQWRATWRDGNYDNRRVDAYYNRRGRMMDQHIAWDRRRMPRDFDDRIYNRFHTHDYQIYRIERPGYSPIFQLLLDLTGGVQTVYVDEYGNVIDYDDWHY